MHSSLKDKWMHLLACTYAWYMQPNILFLPWHSQNVAKPCMYASCFHIIITYCRRCHLYLVNHGLSGSMCTVTGVVRSDSFRLLWYMYVPVYWFVSVLCSAMPTGTLALMIWVVMQHSQRCVFCGSLGCCDNLFTWHFQVDVADINNYVHGKPPYCRMIVQPRQVTTPQNLRLVAAMEGLKKPKTIDLCKYAQFVDLVCQVFYHRHEGSYNCWRVTLAVFPKRLHKVSSARM